MGACVDVVVYSGLEGQYGSQRLHLQTGGLRLWRLRLQVGEDMHAWATSEWRVAVGPSRCIKFTCEYMPWRDGRTRMELLFSLSSWVISLRCSLTR